MAEMEGETEERKDLNKKGSTETQDMKTVLKRNKRY